MTLVADYNPAVSVPFSRMRQLLEDTALQAGVVGATDLKVAQRGAGANMSVDVPAGQAWVEVTTGTRNGLAHIVNDATANVVVSASNGTNPRIDQIILRYNDSSIPTGSGDVPTLAVLTGTATGGATLDNRTGAAALSADSIRLADILVPATSTSVTTANIRDRRPWARGAFWFYERTAGDYTPVAATIIDATNMAPRIECSGVPLRIVLAPGGWGLAGATIDLEIRIDAVAHTVPLRKPIQGSAGDAPVEAFEFVTAITAGSHVIAPYCVTNTSGGTIKANATYPLRYWIEETIRPNASNT